MNDYKLKITSCHFVIKKQKNNKQKKFKENSNSKTLILKDSSLDPFGLI